MQKAVEQESNTEDNTKVAKVSFKKSALSSRFYPLCLLTMTIVGIAQFIVLVLLACHLVKISDAYQKYGSKGYSSDSSDNYYNSPNDREWSVTEYSVPGLVQGRARPGQLIFQDEFNSFNLDQWEHEITASGGGNWEFQIYENNRSNSFVKYGRLYIKPTMTVDKYGKDFLTTGRLQLGGGAPADACTNPTFFGCDRQGTETNLINPVISARIRTLKSFSFKYGKVHVRAKLPLGDYLWPAIWMMPKNNQYSGWPSSGEIDIMESRGNEKLFDEKNQHVGVERVGSTLHFGPFWPLNGWEKAHFTRNSNPGEGFNLDFHVYELEWTPEHIRFSIDGTETGTVRPSEGFWKLGEFPSNLDNPWKYSENDRLAPFDQQFYLIINLAVGGTNGFFSDTNRGPTKKPWFNNSTQAFLDFWNKKSEWYPTWKGDESALQVDYVRVWAL